MLHHRTTDIAKRVEHVTNQLEKEHEQEEIAKDINYMYKDWPRWWLDTYDEVRREFYV